MRLDALMAFVPLGSPLSMVAAAGVDVPSNVFDLLGFGVGVVAPSNGNPIIGTPTIFGSPDAGGVGGTRPSIAMATGTAFVTATAATLNAALQAAADDGTGNPSTWQTLAETGELTAAQLVANTVFGRLPFLPPFPENLRPRFLRLLFQIPAATLFTAGTVAYAIPTFLRDDQFNRQAARNYVVG